MVVHEGLPADPLGFWQTLHPNPRHGFFFGSGAGTSNDSVIYMSAGEPTRVWQVAPDKAASLLQKIKKSISKKFVSPRFIGFLSFEAGRSFDAGVARLPVRPNPLKVPGAVFGDYPAIVKLDFSKRITTFITRRGGSPSAPPRPPVADYGSRSRRTPSPFKHINQNQFSKMVASAKESIAAGDIYQANLSFRFEKKFDRNPIDLYRALCRTNPSPYSCLIKFGDDWIVSCSPELLLRVEGKRVVTRPIAGTRPRGVTRAQDIRRRGQLLLSPKERAEHVMLVDLERNDLGRVCAPGSVKVTEAHAVERYSHVMHIVSEVQGKLAPRKTSIDALKAVFPGGTITGCPKIKSIEVIEKLEKIARGPFYGSAGFICDNGDAVFNILIRTALVTKKKVFVQAGAGIVADSHPTREYREVLAKARVLLEAAS